MDEEDKSLRLLYTGGSDSIIHVYELLTFKEKYVMPCWNPYNGHMKKIFSDKNHKKSFKNRKVCLC